MRNINPVISGIILPVTSDMPYLSDGNCASRKLKSVIRSRQKISILCKPLREAQVIPLKS